MTISCNHSVTAKSFRKFLEDSFPVSRSVDLFGLIDMGKEFSENELDDHREFEETENEAEATDGT